MRLSVDNVSKAFASVQALDGVSMAFDAGEIHALTGENGAGKSTLIKLITGVHRPDSGSINRDGHPLALQSPRDALAAGVAAVHQERNLIPRFSVAENILLERPPLRRGLLDTRALYEQARAALRPLDPGIDVRAPVQSLSVAQMQIVEIAKGLSLDARLLLLDEPTASITSHETAAMFAILRRLRADGVAIVFVSHKLEEVLAIADRVSVLRDGRCVAANQPIAGMSRQRLVSLVIGREERTRAPRRPEAPGEVALQLSAIATAHGHRGVTLTLHSAEILGLYGLVGAGRTELARAVVGATKITGGEIFVRGRRATIRDPHAALTRYRIGYVSEDRKGEGLIVSHAVGANIALTVWRQLASVFGLFSRRAERAAVEPYVRKLAIKLTSLDQPASTLSGGNQQKVAVAKWLAASTDILIIDEPTAGIDIGAKAEMHALIDDLARQGLAVLLISSDMTEMIGLADRVLVMHRSAIVAELVNNHDYETMSGQIMAAIQSAAASQPHD